MIKVFQGWFIFDNLFLFTEEEARKAFKRFESLGEATRKEITIAADVVDRIEKPQDAA